MPTLDWIGKKAVLNHHREVPFRLLKTDPALSVGDPDCGNLIVQGDNLLALKALLPYYAGQIKCIYIDPPYNTGNQSWVYNDAVNSPEMRDWLGKVVGREAEDLSRHDKWLCMMYPRLCLLRRFLREDGVLFVSIDDTESDYLRLVLDEVFGRPNWVGTIIWKNATDNNPTRIVPEHEYVLCYAKSISKIPATWKAETIDTKQRLIDIGMGFVQKFKSQPDRQKAYTEWYRENRPHLWPFQDYKFIDDGGVYTGMRSVHNPGKEGYRYDVIHPETGRPCQEPLMGYRFPEETMNELIRKDRIIFGDDETKIIELKVYASDYRAKLSSLFELDGRRGTNELKALFPEHKRPFDFPKPTGLVEELLSFTTSGDDIVLDSFAGSGTTGQAVMQLNMADGGNRRFLLVEMDENICRELTAVRLARVLDRDKEKVLPQHKKRAGFCFATLGDPLFDENGNIRTDLHFADLAAHVFFVATGIPLPKRKNGKTPLLGVHNGVAIYLLFNGILGDKTPQGGNVLTRAVLELLPRHDGPKVVFGTGCRVGPERLRREQITFRQIPYEVRTD